MTFAFLSCDWGTSQFRLRLVEGPRCAVIAEMCSEDGVGRLAATCAASDRAEVFRSTLAGHVATLERQLPSLPRECPVIVSGMASSTIGWTELPYAALPFRLDGIDVVHADLGVLRTSAGSHRVFLLSGLRGDDEIMRGEETQMLGLTRSSASRLLEDEAIAVLPGTHSKHIHVQSSRIISFETYMTGEIFGVLSKYSVLNHSVNLPAGNDSPPPALLGPAREAFEEGVKAVRSAPLLRQLFRVRTRQVLRGCDGKANRAFLSGLLVGAELEGLAGQCTSSISVILCSGELLSEPYEVAWKVLGLNNNLHVLSAVETERLSVLGHAVALERLLARKP